MKETEEDSSMYLRNSSSAGPFLAVVLILLFIPISLDALTVEQGRIKLVLHEDTGKFSLYYLEDLKKNSYTSLFFERDPRTSSLGLLVDNKILTLGPTSRFEQTTERTVDGARFIWVSSQLRVTETFRFIKSRQRGLVDAVEIEIHVRNDGRGVSEVGVHLLIDTYLGEDGKAHFISSDGEEIRSETEYSSTMPAFWVSPEDSDQFDGLLGMLKGEGISRPERVVFANWKRLNEELWNLNVRSDRNFNLPPYSINDSAVCYFYGRRRLASGDNIKVSTVLGASKGGPFEPARAGGYFEPGGAPQSSASLENLRKSLSKAEEVESTSAEKNLIIVNDVLSNIDSLLSHPEDISAEKIEILEEALSSIEEQKKAIEGD